MNFNEDVEKEKVISDGKLNFLIWKRWVEFHETHFLIDIKKQEKRTRGARFQNYLINLV